MNNVKETTRAIALDAPTKATSSLAPVANVFAVDASRRQSTMPRSPFAGRWVIEKNRPHFAENPGGVLHRGLQRKSVSLFS